MASKKKSAGSTTKPAPITNKSEFVRSLPADMPGKEVVEKAKAHGLKLSVAYVYSIRTAAKAGRGRPRGEPRGALSIGSSRAEDLLRAVAAELGLSRAISVLQAEQVKVRSVLGR